MVSWDRSKSVRKDVGWRESPGGSVVSPSTSGGMGWMPGLGMKILRVVWHETANSPKRET